MPDPLLRQSTSAIAVAAAVCLSARVPDLRPQPKLELHRQLATENGFGNPNGPWPTTAKLIHQDGPSHYFNVLATEDTLAQQCRRIADLEVRDLPQDVALVRALGGKFTS